MKLGASFSHRHLKYLGLDPNKALKEFSSLNLDWIRLACYWSDIEDKKGKYDFSEVEKIIKYCDKKNINIVLTVGMKAPRWPEYYIPNWLLKDLKLRKLSKIGLKNKYLLDHSLKFIDKSINHFIKYKSIKVWQIENEPLDPTGPKKWRIDYRFLGKEVELVRKLDKDRKILTSTWGNLLTVRKVYKKLLDISDIVSFNIHLRHPIPFIRHFRKYSGPVDSKKTFISTFNNIKAEGKSAWIAELQAEPWEPDEIVTKKKNPPSFLPKHFKKNLSYAKDLNPEVTLLWGFEYWYWKKVNGDNRYWEEAKSTIATHNS